VVDCFDALTADRPYRRALSDHDAIAILLERRGTMYDPDVVDAFLRIYRECRPVLGAVSVATARPDSTPATARTMRAEDMDATGEHVNDSTALAVASLARVASDRGTPSDLLSLAAMLVQSHVPGATCAFHRATGQGSLVLSHVVGELAPLLQGSSIAGNQSVTGWVAANRQHIVNSDAALDLAAMGVPAGRRMCMSTPLIDAGRLVGVLTLYTQSTRPLTDEQVGIVEMIASRALPAITRMQRQYGAIRHMIVPPAEQYASRRVIQ
jgi:GAF domain-containing protein